MSFRIMILLLLLFLKIMWTGFNGSSWIYAIYTIVGHRGRNTVMKLIEGMLNTRRKHRANQAMAGTDMREVDQKITHFSKLIHRLNFTTFRPSCCKKDGTSTEDGRTVVYIFSLTDSEVSIK